jgi:superfamily I DNA and/or RNA helicase
MHLSVYIFRQWEDSINFSLGSQKESYSQLETLSNSAIIRRLQLSKRLKEEYIISTTLLLPMQIDSFGPIQKHFKVAPESIRNG